MECEFTIKSTANDPEISIISKDNENTITNVIFKINTVDENVNDRSSNIINQIEIHGTFEKDDQRTNEKCAEILKWSISNKKDSVYRNIQIIIKSQQDIIREYNIENVFCEDYTEDFSSAKQGTFTLKMAQKKGYLDTIKAFSD